ncbi:MAG: alanine--tRNA ligase-related protein, partial [bacterium]|nr:alanine--tRNA ligase-related protein [bacterium]
GGPSSEVFFEFTDVKHDSRFGPTCHPNCDCGRFMEIGNNVFMTYKKTAQGFAPLEKKNIDFGGGLERLAAVVNRHPDVFTTSLFSQIINSIEEFSGKKYTESENQVAMRIIADHLKGATFLIVDGVKPANKAQGYFLRRILRRAAVKMHQLKGGMAPIPGFQAICRSVMETYADTPYFDLSKDTALVDEVIADEMGKFAKTLDKGLREIEKMSPFDLLQSYGFPVEITEELLAQKGKKLNWAEFERHKQQHQELSRTASVGMFKGGLQDQSETTTKYHTATHLIHAALRQVLGRHVQQKGSNITSARLRFDFSHPTKLTPDQLAEVEKIVNEQIALDISVERLEMDKDQALGMGALAFFPEKYPSKTSVYKIGDVSLELCGGPHVQSTSEIGRIKLTRQEQIGAGVARLYAQLE